MHEHKILLQDSLVQLLEEIVLSESDVAEAVKPIKEPKVKNLADKKKKLIRSKTDLMSILKSKSNTSVKWKKLRDVNTKLSESVQDISEIAEGSNILCDD